MVMAPTRVEMRGMERRKWGLKGGRIDRPLFLVRSGTGGRARELRMAAKFLSWALG